MAETSLTIDDIDYVVDPGFVKQKIYCSKTANVFYRPKDKQQLPEKKLFFVLFD